MEMPSYKIHASADDKSSGKGFIYALSIPFIVDGVLGYLSESKIIKTAIADIYDKLPPDATEDDIVSTITVTDEDE